MNSVKTLVLPLRIPVELDLDLLTPLQAWLEYQQDNAALNNQGKSEDDTNNDRPPTVLECQIDLERLQRMRRTMAHALQQSCHSFTACWEQAVPSMQEYVAALAEFLQHEYFWLPCVDHTNSRRQQQSDGSHAPKMSSTFHASYSYSFKDDDAYDDNINSKLAGNRYHSDEPCWNPLRSHWQTLGSDHIDVFGGLEWERANIIWNLCTLEIYRATQKDLTKKTGWVQTGAHLCTAAALLRRLRTEELYPESTSTASLTTAIACSTSSIAFQPETLRMWEYAILAEAQRTSYEAFRKLPRPRHFMLAKLAAAAIPLYQQVDSDTALKPVGSDVILRQRYQEWSVWCRAWESWMTALMHYHQAMEHLEQQQNAMVMARLNVAVDAVDTCRRVLSPSSSSSPLRNQQYQKWEIPVEPIVQDMLQERQEMLEEGGPRPIPLDELPEIPTQSSLNMTPDLSQLLPSLHDHFFQGVLSPRTRQYVQDFRHEMEQLVFAKALLGEEHTERARKALAAVQLPHSLTAYRQELAGGGVPEDLWERVQLLQIERRESHIKSELWELQDQAEQARRLLKQVSQQLDEDLEMDRYFRKSYPDYAVSSTNPIEDIQQPFRTQMQRFQRLMTEAEESDALVVIKSETLETDPKFRLLRMSKSQLDRLFPGSSGDHDAINVTALSQHLVDLSLLFRDREGLVQALREEVKTVSIVPQLQELEKKRVHDEEAYRQVAASAKLSFQHKFLVLEQSIERQGKLLAMILKENEFFMEARQQKAGGEAFIVKLEDALEEIDHLTDHLREGKAFYDSILPKLQKWKLAVEDMSARVAIDRCDYEDSLRRNRQEAEDARMAATYGQSTSSRTESITPPRVMATHPGVQSVSIHGSTRVTQVDDEKVASLLAMDFDPDAIVAALLKYNNDMDQALNELLGG